MRETARQNPECPDFTSHYENVADRLVPDHSDTVSPEQDAAILAAAQAEYLSCEGH